MADFDDMFGENGTSLIEDAAEDIEEAMHSVNMVCMDANAGAREMDGLVRLCEKWKVRCWFEPTTSIKCTRIVEADALKSIAYMSPNETELRNIAGAVVAREEKIRRNESVSKSAVAQRSIEEGCVNESEMDGGELMPCARRVLVAANRGSGNRLKILCTRGAKGVTRYQLGEDGDVQEDHFPAVRLRAGEMKNTTGAGDCFTGRCIAGLVKGEEEDVAIREGIIAAARCCRAEEAVPFGQGFAAKL